MDSPESVVDAHDTRLRERSLAYLALAGGVLALVTVLLPPKAEESEIAVVVCGLVALLTGGLLITTGERRSPAPLWLLNVAALLGTALIALATLAGGYEEAGTADNAILFLWVALWSFYFLPTKLALLQLVGIAAADIVLLASTAPTSEAPTRFVVTIGTLLVAGLMVRQLRESLERSAAAAAEQGRRDPLTGALNRLGLQELAGAELEHAGVAERPVGFLLVDLDQFRMYNDLQGHAAGDQLLGEVASCLEEHLRDGDSLARLEGDKFAVLLPDADEAETSRAAERLLDGLRAHWRGAVETTVSIGGCSAPAAEHDLDDLWHAAERTLDVARQAGGDRFHLARDRVGGGAP